MKISSRCQNRSCFSHHTHKKWPLTLWKMVCQCLKKLHTHQPGDSAISLLAIYTREGNGNPLQCSCLENPRDGGAWWAAVYGVAQSRTRLKRLSSSNSRIRNSNVRPKTYVHTNAHSHVVCNQQKWKQPRCSSALNEYRNCVASTLWNTTQNKKPTIQTAT